MVLIYGCGGEARRAALTPHLVRKREGPAAYLHRKNRQILTLHPEERKEKRRHSYFEVRRKEGEVSLLFSLDPKGRE